MSATLTAAPAKAGATRSSGVPIWLKTAGPLIGGFLLLLAVAAASVWLIVNANRFNEAVTHTVQVRSTGYRLLTLIQDAETGERGFLLTGNPDYLRPYYVGRDQAPRVIADLERLVADDTDQTATVRELRAGLQDKLADLRLTVGLGQAHDIKAALAHVNLNIGNDIMERIRSKVAELEGEETRKQAAQKAAAEANNRMLGGASIAGILVVFMLAGFAVASSNRSTRHIMEAQEALRHTNENLEGIVAERVQELQVANEEIQRFAYIVSHDLRAPLVNVMGFTSELDATRGDIAGFMKKVEAEAPQLVTPDARTAVDTDLPEALGFIRTSTAKMDRLINAILKLSREGRRVLTPQKIALGELIKAQGESLTQQLEAGDAELKVQDDLPDIVSDRLAIEQIFGNLIENAIKYLSPGRPGRIDVSGKSHGAYLRYEIADNGRGIEAKDFERVFELFRRSGEQNTAGEGIGLAYVRNLARRLGGNVTVQSELGKGSTFTVLLPATFSAKARVK